MQLSPTAPEEPALSPRARLIALLLGPALAVLLTMLPAPEGMSAQGWRVCAIALWMVVWWISEAMPLAVTSLLPLVVFPLFDIMPLKEAGTSFGNPVIFLFMGGFMLAASMRKWQLHTRLAYLVLTYTAHSARAVLAGLMLVTAIMAMWMSNTATAVLMFPIAMSIGLLLQEKSGGNLRAPKAIALGIAYASVLGGLSTFIGTPTNAMLYAHMQSTYQTSLSLSEWMSFGVPLSALSLLFAWVLLSQMYLREMPLTDDLSDEIAAKRAALGPLSQGEKNTAMVFFITVALWLCSSWLEGVGIVLEDASIAIFAALALFLLPVNLRSQQFTLEWRDAEEIPWGILVFFAGSLALSAAFTATGVSDWLGTQLEALHGVPTVLIVLAVVTLIIAASEMMSNVATISVFLPILSVLAEALHVNPLLFLLPATLAASCGFMLPGASAPNAIAYATGIFRVKEMVRAGFWMDLMAVMVITLATFTLVDFVMGVR